MLQMFPFFPFSQQHASTTDGEFLRHETWRVRLTNRGMEGKEKEHNQIPEAELNSIRLDGAVPRAKCRGGNWDRAEVGFTGRDDGPCAGAYRWGRGGSAFLVRA